MLEQFDADSGLLLGERIEKLVIERYKHKVEPLLKGSPLKVGSLRDAPYPQPRGGGIIYGRTDGISTTIYVRKRLRRAQREHNFAHELMHLEMDLRGHFPRSSEFAGWHKLVWQAVCEGYIDGTLAREGFFPGLNILSIKETAHIREVVHSGIVKDVPASERTLIYIQNRLRFPGELSRSLIEIYQSALPQSFEFGESVVACLESMDLREPDVQIQAIRFVIERVNAAIPPGNEMSDTIIDERLYFEE